MTAATRPAPPPRRPVRAPFLTPAARAAQLRNARTEAVLIVRMGLASYLLSVGIPLPDPTVPFTTADLLAHLDGRLLT